MYRKWKENSIFFLISLSDFDFLSKKFCLKQAKYKQTHITTLFREPIGTAESFFRKLKKEKVLFSGGM